jgi:hypothetical protein
MAAIADCQTSGSIASSVRIRNLSPCFTFRNGTCQLDIKPMIFDVGIPYLSVMTMA